MYEIVFWVYENTQSVYVDDNVNVNETFKRWTINNERKDSLWLYENENDDENFVWNDSIIWA